MTWVRSVETRHRRSGTRLDTLDPSRPEPALLGRVSSLDFFVSLALMPVSMALAGPVGEAIGLAPAFLLAGLVPPVLAISAIFIFRMPRDELEHPLDTGVEPSKPADRYPSGERACRITGLDRRMR